MIVESLALALALCVDSLVVSTTSAFKSKMCYQRGMLMATTFGIFQGLFPLLGALLGTTFRDIVSSIDHWIAFGLLLAVGGKMLWDAFHEEEDGKALDVSKFGTMCLLGIATSIDAFVVGIGLGLNGENTLSDILITVTIITVVTIVVSMVGVFLGKRQVPIPEKIATIIAGLVLIALGTYTLLEHIL